MSVGRIISALFVVLLLASPHPVAAQGTCVPGEASADLDVNNVRARLYNNGSLFWSGAGNVYTVPKDGDVNAIFASSIWIGGLANGEELRFAGTNYGPWEYWPGPLDEDGNPPEDCSLYDRIYSVYRSDVEAVRTQGIDAATDDVLDWPSELGAPYVDVNDDGAYEPAEGDFPELMGDQTLWWVMNDAGNTKNSSGTAPIGLEVRVTAFAFQSPGALNDATIYKYRLIHKGEEPLVDTYFGIFSDPDLGNPQDDFVGSDSLLNLGFVYNGDDADEDERGYGDAPPALGYDVLQGPLVPAPGEQWVDPDGTVHVDSVRRGLTTFLLDSSDSGPTGHPDMSTDDPYMYLQGIWRDGRPMTFGGNGYGGQLPTHFMYSGEAATREYWSEENTDDHGSRNTPADRSFLMSTGPFTLHPGDVQDVVFSIVWARGENRLVSVAEMKKSSNVVQESLGYESDPPFELSAPADPPTLLAPDDDVDGQFTNPTLVWESLEGAGWYQLQVAPLPDFQAGVLEYDAYEASHAVPDGILDANTTYFWRVRGLNPRGAGPWSGAWEFGTSGETLLPAAELRFEQIVEVSIGDSGPLEPKNVWHALNHEGYGDRYYLGSTGTGSIDRIMQFIHSAAPRDFELRFTEDGSYGVYAFENPLIASVPFELWDVGIATPDDPTDDVRMIPFLLSNTGEPSRNWEDVTGTEPYFGYPSWDAVYFLDPISEDGYEMFEQTALDAGGAGAIYPLDHNSPHCGFFAVGCSIYPIGRVLIADFDRNGEPPPPGTTIRFITTKPEPPQVPALSAPRPAAALSGEGIELWWQAKDRLHLQVARDPAFEDLIVDDSSGTEPPYALMELEDDAAYYWRARTSNVLGTSDWSPAWSFYVESFVDAEDRSPLPEAFAIEAVYPNPFRDAASIRFAVPEAASVRISVYDVLGRRVAVLQDATLPAGRHDASWDAAGNSSGIYFIRMEAGGRLLAKQVVRVR